MRSTNQRQPRILGLYSAVLLGSLFFTGCTRDVRLADRKLRSVNVETVSLFGVTLDSSATPEQVAFVLLRAIREDFEATSQEDRETALDKQFQISAAGVIQARNNISLTKEEFLYKVVSLWTPTVSHYVGDFETQWESAKARFISTPPRAVGDGASPGMECEVYLEVSDPGGDINAGAVMVIWLAKDNELWRVVHLGFDRTVRSLTAAGKKRNG